MAKFKFTGIEAYTESLEKIGGKNAKKVIKYAVYPGAGVVADAIRNGLEAHRDSGELSRSITLTQMQDKNGYIYTKVTFTGYDSAKVSEKFPRGVPNAVKAASLESGNSRGQKGTHVISKAVKTVKERAISEMSKALDEKIGQIMEG